MAKASKKKGAKIRLMIAVMLTTALFLTELYLMLTAASNITLIAGIGGCILAAVSFVVSSVLDCVDEKAADNKEQYDNISKSEKASYILLKKRLEELSKQVQALDNNSSKKENGSAEIIKAQKTIARAAIGKSKETQDRLFIELNNLEASLNDSVHDLSKRLSGFQEEIERLADHIAKINTEAIKEAARGSQLIREVPVEAVAEDELMEESSIENILDSIGLDFEDKEPEPTPEPIPVPAPTPTPAPADDGGKMNQDDIAALIASMTGGDAEPVEEPEPIPEPAPLSVDDNPNRMMTPEEIAALLASM